MSISKKQFLHYQGVANQSLDKFRKIAQNKQMDRVYKLIENDWRAFINDKARLQRYIDHVTDAASIFGFSRELSDKLSYGELINRVAERFSEIDLAEHAIRELGLPKTGEKLEKIAEGVSKRCDFKFSGKPPYYFESKYTKKLAIGHLATIVEGALEQIKNSIDNAGIGCVWIFTYAQPDSPSSFQQEVMKIKKKYSNIGFPFKLNVQVYSSGLYGDAIIYNSSIKVLEL